MIVVRFADEKTKEQLQLKNHYVKKPSWIIIKLMLYDK
jgi:hypothetical protein